ncbi:MAG: UDP-N-acetylmuramoyl-tripeptide--D-alanyl-D-alanine ligase [Actinomycetota bacterium]
MRTRRASDVARAVSGDHMGPDRLVHDVVIDSRDVREGSLFFALPGERTDGHRYVSDALHRGAAACVVSRAFSPVPRSIIVDSPGEALIELARSERRAVSWRVIGITGSVGKTTTKDFATAVLRPAFRVAGSPRSFNNEIGVPLTILDADQRTEVLVAELGAGTVGEIAMLCGIARPDVGVVTAVGPAHLETFGSLQTVARAKAELVEALPPSGLAILNADDRVVASFAARTDARVLRFGRHHDADVRAHNLRTDTSGHARFTLVHEDERVGVRLGVIGEHMLTPALGAVSCGIAFGLSPAACAAGLEGATPSPGRMQELTTPTGTLILHDAYNANPMSMLAALRALAAVRNRTRAIAVLGPMAQLGASSRVGHEQIGRAAADLGLHGLIAVGEQARPIADGALAGGMARERVRWCLDRDEALNVVLNSAGANDVVLVKASRLAHLEELVQDLLPR